MNASRRRAMRHRIFRVEHGKLSSAIAVVEDNLTRMAQLGIEP
jgi:hypothetical protein